MRKISNSLKIKSVTSLAIILMVFILSACDKTPSEHLQALNEDKYSVANIPDEQLETLFKIDIELERLTMTSL